MPTTTFAHLDPAKQQRIQAALLTEFSTHALAEAQVARIVKDAAIARGAFYQYFADLTDAYQYLYGQALQEIHHATPDVTQAVTVGAYTQSVAHFVDQASASRYYALIQRHFTQNEGALPAQSLPVTMPVESWAAVTLCHATIKEILLAPTTRDACLARLERSLTKLVG